MPHPTSPVFRNAKFVINGVIRHVQAPACCQANQDHETRQVSDVPDAPEQ